MANLHGGVLLPRYILYSDYNLQTGLFSLSCFYGYEFNY
jgi:hypothetical protein